MSSMLCGTVLHGAHAKAVGTEDGQEPVLHIIRVGQNRIYTPYLTEYLAIFLPKIPYIRRIYIWFWPTLHIICGNVHGIGCGSYLASTQKLFQFVACTLLCKLT